MPGPRASIDMVFSVISAIRDTVDERLKPVKAYVSGHRPGRRVDAFVEDGYHFFCRVTYSTDSLFGLVCLGIVMRPQFSNCIIAAAERVKEGEGELSAKENAFSPRSRSLISTGIHSRM